MIDVVDRDLQDHQREVQRMLGRCMLRLQQYERLVKAIVAHHDLTGPAHALESIRSERVTEVASKTLGTLVGQLLGTCVIANGTDTSVDALDQLPQDIFSFSMKMQLSLSADDHARIKNDLRELVLLRNKLIHHFIDQHDLWSLDGCREGYDALVDAYTRIDKHFEQLRGWAEHMDQAQRLAAEFVQSDAFLDLVIHGIAPDGSVNWPSAAIVSSLHEASEELGVEGWTPVDSAEQWIEQRHPDRQPAKYGCASWRQVLHESRLFELRYREVDGRRSAWYRARAR